MITHEANKIVEMYANSREGAFVCVTCCDQGVLECVGGDILIFHCEAHMTLCIRDGEVLSAQTNGIRQ